MTKGGTVANVQMDMQADADGTVVVRLRGVVGAESAVELRQTLVYAVRRLRPHRLIIDLSDVRQLDSINMGTIVAITDLAADHRVVLFLDGACPAIATGLHEAGVHHRHLRTPSLAGDLPG